MNVNPVAAPLAARVLIVDDERVNRQILEVMLRADGVQVQTTGSGAHALALLARQPPDLILLDIMMPEMDGFELTRRLKDNAATRHIPVILVTALDDRESRLQGLSAGAEDFVTKPVDRAELSVRVRNLLRLKTYRDEQERQAILMTEQAALLDLAEDAIVVFNMQNRIVFWSRGAEVMYGWPSEEAVGRDRNALLRMIVAGPPEDVDAMLLLRGHWDGEAFHDTRDGGRLMVAIRCALQRDALGKPMRTLTISNDISARKKAEYALEAARTEQLRFKDAFFSHVSHELRSPLTAIKQFTTIILGNLAGELNDEQRRYEEIVLKNVHQLQSMIDDLLEVTALTTGKLAVELQVVSVLDAVNDAVDTLRVTAGTKGVTVVIHPAPDLPPAHADPVRLRQILIILLDNAVKFTARGGTATIQASLSPTDPGFLLFDVSDTGCGISPELADRIFERLYQVPAATAPNRKGLGLGLSICKELVSRQGGRVWLRSQVGMGSTFSFTLPIWTPAKTGSPKARLAGES